MKSGLFRVRTPRTGLLVALLLLAALLAFGSQSARAATTRTWMGTTDANWGTATNWSPAGAPVDGDVLVFPSAGANEATNNDVPNLDVVSLQFAGGYSVTGMGLTVDTGITVNLGSTANVSLTVPVTLGGDGAITVVEFQSLTLAGQPLALAIGAHMATFAGEGQTEITGDVTGTGGVAVAPDATLIVSTAMSYTGSTSVTGGTLGLNGGSISNLSVVSVSGGGRIGGVGSTGPLAVTGSLLYPGIFGSFVAGAIASPSLTLDAFSTVRFNLAGTAFPGSYDQISVNGPVALGGSALDLRWDLEPAVGEQFDLMTGATSLTGSFAGLPEGAVFFARGRRFSVTYVGGAGHDVVVTRLPAAPADLSIALVSSSAVVAPGGTVTLTVTVTNHGPGDAPLVSVSADLPAQLLFQSVSAPAGFSCATPGTNASGQVRCAGGEIAAGDTATFTVTAKASPSTSGQATIYTAVSSAAAETASTNNSTFATITLGQPPRAYRVFAPNVARD